MTVQNIPIERVAFVAGMAFLVCVALLFVFRKIVSTLQPVVTELDLQERKLANLFSSAIRRGVAPKDVARVYSQMDLAFLRSLLASAGIPSETLFVVTNNLRMGVAVQGYNDMILRVLYTDTRQQGISFSTILTAEKPPTSELV